MANEYSALDKKLSEAMCASQREKYWSELSQEEKINKLARTINYQNRRIAELEDKMSRLFLHQHGTDGTLLVRLEQHYPVQTWDSIDLDK